MDRLWISGTATVGIATSRNPGVWVLDRMNVSPVPRAVKFRPTCGRYLVGESIEAAEASMAKLMEDPVNADFVSGKSAGNLTMERFTLR